MSSRVQGEVEFAVCAFYVSGDRPGYRLEVGMDAKRGGLASMEIPLTPAQAEELMTDLKYALETYHKAEAGEYRPETDC